MDFALDNQQYSIKPNLKNHVYLLYMYKDDDALNNLHWILH